jgi:uncharacterized membrane protein YbhN (UPF0104 family)
MAKKILINSLKILIAAGLIGWLLKSGKLDFSLLVKLADHPLAVALSILFAIFNLVVCSIRWRSILGARSNSKIPLSGMVKSNWIGMFFSSVLPGSVTGDIVKSLYVQKFDPTFSKKFVFASILIDRLMGLSGLILLVGFSSVFFSGHILKNAPDMKPLLDINFGLAVLVILSLLIFFFFHDKVRLIFKKLELAFAPNIWGKVIQLWDDLVLIKSHMMRAVGMSVLVQLGGVIAFWCLIFPFVGGHMDFVQALAFIPIGLMTLALPIAPSGLGVGHAIFQKLFEFSGIDNGASLFNLYFCVTLIVNIFGVIPYMMTKRYQ